MYYGRRRRDKKPTDVTSLACGISSMVVVVLFVLAIIHSVSVKGNNGHLVPGVGVLLLIVSIISLVYGVRERKREQFSTWSRVIGIVFPAIGTASWVVIYLIGLFFA